MKIILLYDGCEEPYIFDEQYADLSNTNGKWRYNKWIEVGSKKLDVLITGAKTKAVGGTIDYARPACIEFFDIDTGTSLGYCESPIEQDLSSKLFQDKPLREQIMRYENTTRACESIALELAALARDLPHTIDRLKGLQDDNALTEPDRAEIVIKCLSEFLAEIGPHAAQGFRHNLPLPPTQCVKPSRISANEPFGWEHGFMCGVRFEDNVDENTKHFILKHRERDGRLNFVAHIELEDNGMWYCGAFTGVRRLEFPSVCHYNFKNLLHWITMFYLPQYGTTVKAEELLMVNNEPLHGEED